MFHIVSGHTDDENAAWSTFVGQCLDPEEGLDWANSIHPSVCTTLNSGTRGTPEPLGNRIWLPPRVLCSGWMSPCPLWHPLLPRGCGRMEGSSRKQRKLEVSRGKPHVAPTTLHGPSPSPALLPCTASLSLICGVPGLEAGRACRSQH